MRQHRSSADDRALLKTAVLHAPPGLHHEPTRFIATAAAAAAAVGSHLLDPVRAASCQQEEALECRQQIVDPAVSRWLDIE